MKKFTNGEIARNNWGGVVLFTILALSLMFASCADNSDTDDENPSPALPANVGENPITKTIKLKEIDEDHHFLELKADGTARAIYVDDDDEGNVDATYKYSYDDKNKIITMIVEKQYYESSIDGKVQVLTYDESCSKIDEEYTVEKMRQVFKKNYEEYQNEKWFKEDYPGCDTYEKYEEALVKEGGFDSFAALVKYSKQWLKNYCKLVFSVQITYAYTIDGDKVTLTEKFTGVKNLSNSRCRFSEGSDYARISCYSASIDYYNDGTYSYYYGDVDTDKKTIAFESEDEDGNREKVNATYEENIAKETVTIKFKDKEYVCKFDGEKYIQED